jgi:hypothetical protein
MSLAQACAQTEAVVQRARSLFASAPQPPLESALGDIDRAAQSTAATARMTGDMSGVLIDRHTTFANQNAPILSSAAHIDAAVQAHVSAAAAVTETGARRLDAIATQTRATSQAAATASTPAAQRAVLVALRSQLSQAADVVSSTQQQASGLAGQVRALKYSPPAGGHGDTQALGFGPGGAPQTPQPDPDPPHGKDPRYWIDVSKIRYVPDGQLAPYGFKQIGPNLYYPAPDSKYTYEPPPDPVRYPLDVTDIRQIPPGSNKLYPWGYMEVAPGIGVPNPDAGYQPSPPWTPREPVDIRDVIQVRPGGIAPWGYVEYLPGWFTPGPELTNTPPTIPKPR